MTASRSTKNGDVDTEDVQQALDRISLEQALHDFDVANERVVDLTKRLVEAYEELRSVNEELERVSEELSALKDRHTAMQHSSAFRLASKIWAIRNLFSS